MSRSGSRRDGLAGVFALHLLGDATGETDQCSKRGRPPEAFVRSNLFCSEGVGMLLYNNCLTVAS
jgi:hypothetical protein